MARKSRKHIVGDVKQNSNTIKSYKAAGYIRLSVVKENQPPNSIENQWIKQHLTPQRSWLFCLLLRISILKTSNCFEYRCRPSMLIRELIELLPVGIDKKYNRKGASTK